jgi:hypothetical protein
MGGWNLISEWREKLVDDDRSRFLFGKVFRHQQIDEIRKTTWDGYCLFEILDRGARFRMLCGQDARDPSTGCRLPGR